MNIQCSANNTLHAFMAVLSIHVHLINIDLWKLPVFSKKNDRSIQSIVGLIKKICFYV